ncbi:MAG: hypothetical protein WCH75_14325 [Candidatus Binatia bacterium]
MKIISVRATLIALFLGLALVTPSQAEDYYIYLNPNGKLFISNKKPPPGSQIIRQRDLPEFSEAQAGKTPSRPTEVPPPTKRN